MREPVTADHLQAFMKALAANAKTPSRIYLVGGASSVLLGWRTSTIDIDLKIIPETDEILRSLPRLKEELHLNIELASPDDFIPELPGILLTIGYFTVVPPLLVVMSRFFQHLFIKMGFLRYMVLTNLLLFMALLPIKMLLRWTVNLKYFISMPEYLLNL